MGWLILMPTHYYSTIPLILLLLSCENGGGFAGSSGGVARPDDAPKCAQGSCERTESQEVAKESNGAEQPISAVDPKSIEKPPGKKQIPPPEQSDSLGNVDEDEEEPDVSDLPQTNPMQKECRGIFVGSTPTRYPGIIESFEWDFTSDSVKCIVASTANGIPRQPVFLSLTFKNRDKDEYVYAHDEIVSTGNKPERLSFICKDGVLTQYEVWGPAFNFDRRTIQLQKKN